MDSTILRLDPYHRIGEVDPRIFGGFLEHLGRAVYEGLYDPKSIHADEQGFRKDVLSALAPMQYTAMRYPGGNFASGYHWMNGIGAREKRPVVQDLAWQSIETNQVGTDEFVHLSRRMNWTPMMTINLGTGTPEEARNWVGYCNSPAGTLHANMRVANGFVEPYNLTLWCLGNEMDGPWQLGHVDYVDTSAILGDAELHVFLVNRSIDSSAPVEIHFEHAKFSGLKSAEILTGPSAQARNTFEQPRQITSQKFEIVEVEDGVARFEMPALSLVALTLSFTGSAVHH